MIKLQDNLTIPQQIISNKNSHERISPSNGLISLTSFCLSSLLEIPMEIEKLDKIHAENFISPKANLPHP